MIWLHVHPLPLSPVRKLSFFLSLPVFRRSTLLAGEGEGGRARSQIIRPRESLVLFKSVNTLWDSLTTVEKLNLKCFNSPQKEKQILKEDGHK
jgi:hypothetical protein